MTSSSSEEELNMHHKFKYILLFLFFILIVVLCCNNDMIKNAFGNKGNINGYSNYAFMGRCNTDLKLLNVGNKFSF